jgi:hypothetical protein
MLCIVDTSFSFDIDQNEIVLAAPEHRETFGITEGRIDFEA